MMHPEKTKLLVNEFIQLLIRRDLTIVDLVGEKPDWYIQGNEAVAPWLGHCRTREEVRRALRLLWSNIKPVSGSIEHIVVDRDVAVVAGEFSTMMVTTGKMLNSEFCMLLKVENDRIVKFRLLEDSYAVFAALSPGMHGRC